MTPTFSSIKSWAVEDRPREKMSLQGRKSLSNAELLAIALGSGSRSESAVSLAKRILHSCQNNLHELAKYSLKDLQKFKGVGPTKAINIIAALELGCRRQASAPATRPQIVSSQLAYDNIAPYLLDLAHEECWVLILDRANRLLKTVKISEGGLEGTLIGTKKLFKRVLAEERASSIILAHNHPSGNPQASKEDIRLTKRLKEAGQLLEIRVWDHIIVAGNTYTSFMDQGYMDSL